MLELAKDLKEYRTSDQWNHQLNKKKQKKKRYEMHVCQPILLSRIDDQFAQGHVCMYASVAFAGSLEIEDTFVQV